MKNRDRECIPLDKCEGIVVDVTNTHAVILLPRGGKTLIPKKGLSIGDRICYVPITEERIVVNQWAVAKTRVEIGECYIERNIYLLPPDIDVEEEELHGQRAYEDEQLFYAVL